MNETIRAAWVVARRDFTALIFSKAFVAFLLGPIIMLGIALAAGGVGARMAAEPARPMIAIAMDKADTARIKAAAETLGQIVTGLPETATAGASRDPAALLRGAADAPAYAAVLSGSLDRPRLDTTMDGKDIWPLRVKLLIETARRDSAFTHVALDVRTVPTGASSPAEAPRADTRKTAQYGQMALFLSTMLLAGMVLSNLVEEKANKIIEILASSIPLESIFLGKLFAMLAMALIAIGIWVMLGLSLFMAAGSALPALTPPAVGWPVFIALGVAYFSTAYLLLGSAYLSIGAMAATVRDVQTLSMPVSMAQLGIFLIAGYATTQPGSAVEIGACIFPFTSPFALLARAAYAPDLWPHALLLGWQALWSLAIVRLGTGLFRRNVLKSSGGRRPFFRRAVPG